MKRKALIAAVAAIIAMAWTGTVSASLVPLAQRPLNIFFQGSLADSKGDACSGQADVRMEFYRTPQAEASDLLYAEEFSGVNVTQGEFRVPVLGGTPTDGSAQALRGADEVYAFVIVDGQTMLEAWALGTKLAAMRAEEADVADSLRLPLEVDASAIPAHPASGHITSGTLNAGRLPQIPASLVTQGVFPTSAMPAEIGTGSITSGTLGAEAFGSGIDASWFAQGTVPDAVMPNSVMNIGTVGVRSGFAGHGQAVGIPAGFDRSQCAWVVGLHKILSQGQGTGIDHVHVYTDSNGVVFCKWDHVTAEPMNYECDANYLTICRK